jgi:hypothetical protein
MRGILEFAREELGLALSDRQKEALLGVSSHSLSLLCCGRRSGKTLIAAVWALYDALVRDLSEHLRPGEPRFVVCVATNTDQARRVMQVMRQFLEMPRLAPLLTRETADELWLRTGVVVKTVPCSARSTRGLAVSTVIFDELSHMIDSESGYQAGEMVYRALAPSVAQFGDDGRLVCPSTPRGERGIFWKLWRLADDLGVYKLQASTAEMNPLIQSSYLALEQARDPDLYRQEFLAQFVAGGGAFLSPDVVRAAVGVGEHKHQVRIVGLDPAFSRDSFAGVCVCTDGERYYVDEIRVFDPPASFSVVLDELAGWIKGLDPSEVVTDQFSSAAIVSEMARRGVDVTAIPWTAQSKADSFATVKTLLNTSQLSLCDDDRLVRELCGLVSEPRASGFAIEGEGEQDDVACALALALSRLHEQQERSSAVMEWRPNPFYDVAPNAGAKNYDVYGDWAKPHPPGVTMKNCRHRRSGCVACKREYRATPEYQTEHARLVLVARNELLVDDADNRPEGWEELSEDEGDE